MPSLQLTPATGVVVTGGASGIGRASAAALAEVGRPVALWDLQADAAADAAAELASAHGVATIGLGVDVTDNDAIADAVTASREALGSLGGLVHAAGAVNAEAIDDASVESWARVVDVNLRAELFLVQALLDDLRAHPGSAVVGIASIDGIVGHGAIPSYCSSKAGLLGLTRSLGDKLADDGIRVNAVCPGYIDTPMLAGAASVPGARGRMQESAPLNRLGVPADIGRVVRFLMSDEAAFMTCTHVVVDGGVTAVNSR